MSREQIVNTAIDHIYEYETRSGKIKKAEAIGGTVGGFHLKYENNRDLLGGLGFTGSSASEFNQWILNNPDKEREMVRRRVNRDLSFFESKGVSLDHLEMGEAVAGLVMVYNTGQPQLTKDLASLSKARKNNSPADIIRLRQEAARSSIDVMRAKGEYNAGLMARSMSAKETFDGILDVKKTYKTADVGKESTYRKTNRRLINLETQDGKKARMVADGMQDHYNKFGNPEVDIAMPKPSPRRKQEQRMKINVSVGRLPEKPGILQRMLSALNPFTGED